MKRFLFPSLALLVFVASCGKAEEGATQNHPIAASVKTAAAAATAVPEYYEAVGTVRARVTTVVSAHTAGHVTRVLVKEGDHVRAGQTLAELDVRDANVQLRRAMAGEAQAQGALATLDREIAAAEAARSAADSNRKLAASTLERFRALHDRRSVSDQEFDEVQSRLSAATAELDRAAASVEAVKSRRSQVLAQIDQANAERSGAELGVGYGQVPAPLSGTVISRNAEVGTFAAPGVPLFTVEDAAGYRFEATVGEDHLSSVRVGMTVLIRVDAAGAPVSGKVVEIVPAADPTTRSYTIKIDLPANPAFRSGAFGRAQFSSGERQAITIPSVLVIQRGQLTGVYVLDDRFIRFRLVKLGKPVGDRVEVLSGLNAGDLLVIEPRGTVADGTEVRK